MQQNGDILEALKDSEARMAKAAQQAVIIQPGALGDCILTLPLAEFIKNTLDLGRVDFLSHTEYTSILPGRTCVDSVRSIDLIDLHRLFVKSDEFDLGDRDPLIDVFAGYQWIVTFLGQANSDFEQNLIFTANCSHSAEAITLQLKPPAGYHGHICDFYIRQFAEQNILCGEFTESNRQKTLITPGRHDISRGRKLLQEIAIDTAEKVVVIHPGTATADKNWGLENFYRLAAQLQAQGLQTLFLLGPAELDRLTAAEFENLQAVAPCMSQLSLTQALALLSSVNVFIGNDSGITHLAAALGIKTLAIFGPTEPSVYKPVGPAVKVFSTNQASFAEPCPATMQKLLETIRQM